MALFRPWALTMLGGWYLMSGWVLSAGGRGVVRANFAVCGAALLLAAAWATLDHPRSSAWRGWVMAGVAAWVAASPWVLGYTHHTFDAGVTLALGALGAADALSLVLWPGAGADSLGAPGQAEGSVGSEDAPAWAAPADAAGAVPAAGDGAVAWWEAAEAGHTVRVPASERRRPGGA